MSGSNDPVSAIVDRMMERLQKENPGVDYKRKAKPCPEKKATKKRRSKRSSLH